MCDSAAMLHFLVIFLTQSSSVEFDWRCFIADIVGMLRLLSPVCKAGIIKTILIRRKLLSNNMIRLIPIKLKTFSCLTSILVKSNMYLCMFVCMYVCIYV